MSQVKNRRESFSENSFKLDLDLNYENEVISQTMQSIADSLDSRIELNFGKEYFNYKTIYVIDSLRDFGEYSVLYQKARIFIDSIKLDKKNNAKLKILDIKLRGGKELKFLTSFESISALKGQYRVLLNFSRVHFNSKYNEGIFTISLSCSFNTGSDYAVYVKKEDNKWLIKRIILSAIS